MHGNGLAPKHLAKQTVITNAQVNRFMRRLLNYFTEKQKSLFLIDSIGALTTAFFLFVVLRKFHAYFGMPGKVLTYLSVLAVFFGMYSAACFFFLKENFAPFFRFIGIANILYCALTTGLLITYYPVLTLVGITYFLIEMVIICVLSYVELTMATRNKEKQIT